MANKTQTEKYLAALERLKAQGKPINNDAVALEAGSGKGSIKKSRAGHADLIAAIEQAAEEQRQAKAVNDPVPPLRQEISLLERRLDEALEREVNLLAEVYQLREEVRQLSKGRLSVASSRSR
jgi:predicted  nucleic acid-binding Zn-ribbon protein